jgi:myo-inositol 2-dehydrogenase / D-chiro-inositol 1-dehydrogenase
VDAVRIGFIGMGGIASAHINQLSEISEARITAVCDIDENRARAAAEPLGAEVYSDGKRLVEDAQIDVLYICVPPNAHGDTEILAARRGLHLFVEKPVNLYLDQAMRVSEAIDEAGILTQTGYSLRYLAGSEQLKAFLADKPVGTGHAFRWNGLPGGPWWRRYDQSGGQLVEMTTHQVDLLRWVLGEVEWVSASYSFGRLHKDESDVTVPDSQTVLLRFESGATVTISTSCAIAGGLMSLDFAVKGARVSWKGSAMSVDPPDAYTLPPPSDVSMNVDQAFIRAVVNNDRSLLRSPYEDAMRTAAVTLAANLSAEEGGRQVRMAEMWNR